MLFSFRDNKTYSCRSKTSGGVGMYKNQLQELAQRSCFNLPSYACIREGPDHAPRFKASVNFNGEIFEGPSYCTTLRQAEHAAAEVALNTLSTRGPSRSLAARVLDETGVYKNLLQETAHRAGLKLPVYTTVRSGPGHLPVFTCTVELAGMNFAGEPAKTKKQAEKNAAMTAWSALKQMPYLGSSSNKETESSEEPEQGVVAKVLSNFRPKYENKSLKQRDQNQARRRVVSGYRDNSSGSSTHNTLQYRQWRSMDLLSDFSSIYPSQQQNQQQNCFSALLPPLTASKILPSTSRENKPSLYSSNRPIPVQVRSRSQVKTQEVPPPLEEHQKDEEEWLGGKSDITEKSIEKDPSANSSCVFTPNPTHQRPFPLPHAGNLNTPMSDYSSRQAQIRTKPFRPPTPIGTITPSAIPLPRFLNTGRYYTQGIAPAVNIRSVIPVCAAPPMRPLSSDPPTLQMKETSHQLSASVSKQTEEELASANSKLNKLQL